jgi:DHA2 family multidrug resistance protein
MQQWVIEDPPYIKRDTKASVDFIGFGLLALWLATMQIVLDKGQEADWFGAEWVRWFTFVSVTAFLGFIIWEFVTDHPVVDLRIFKNRNYATGVMLMTALAAVLYGTVAAQPLFMQTLLGYTALQSGYAISPRGLGAFTITLLVGRVLVGRVRNRILMVTGFALLALSSLWQSQINLDVAWRNVAWPSVLNGVAIGFIFVPLTTVTMGHLAQKQISNATGMFNLMRNLGGSLGIAFVSTMLSRDAQTHQAMMVSHLTAYDPAYGQHLAAAKAAFGAHTAGPGAQRDLHPTHGPGAVVGVRGQFPHLQPVEPVLHPAGLLVQAGQTRRGTVPRRALSPVTGCKLLVSGLSFLVGCLAVHCPTLGAST